MSGTPFSNSNNIHDTFLGIFNVTKNIHLVLDCLNKCLHQHHELLLHFPTPRWFGPFSNKTVLILYCKCPYAYFVLCLLLFVYLQLVPFQHSLVKKMASYTFAFFLSCLADISNGSSKFPKLRLYNFWF